MEEEYLGDGSACKTISYPAPRRCWERTAHGFCSHRWTIDDVLFAMSAGAWFSRDAGHEFDCASTKQFALGLS